MFKRIKNDFKKIDIDSLDYPESLKHIDYPPKNLYYLGDCSLLKNNCLAIIGCRSASKYGLKISNIFSDGVSKAGITIVSGLAKGIDKIAHEASINNIGKTIAVLGNGVDIIYPAENEELYYKIINNGGLIISEFEPGVLPLKENFPRRNRIISGISRGVLVVEAKKRSGTMTTVNHAINQGKEIYVIPGNIDSLNSIGTNDLIKDGAKLVTNFKEIVCDFGNISI